MRLEVLKTVLMFPSVDCGCLYQASEADELQMKRDLVRQYKKGSELDSFFALLPAAKQRRVEAYTQVPKVAEWLAQRREVVAWLGHPYMCSVSSAHR
ncbi:unnamed protein product [Effrenium voratum]|nr:unnamed protein product [Effrenium voratum]